MQASAAAALGMARHGGTGLLQASAMSIIASVPSMNSNSTPACSFSQLCRCATSSGVHTQLEAHSAAAAAQHLRRQLSDWVELHGSTACKPCCSGNITARHCR